MNFLKLAKNKTFIKKIFPLVLLLLFIFLAVMANLGNKDKNEFTITSEKNKFNLNFEFKKNDKSAAQNFLEKLSLPRNILDGTTIELDEKTTSEISFFTPINGNFLFEGNKLILSGDFSSPPVIQSFTPNKNIKIPSSVKIVVFSKDFTKFIEENFNLNEDFQLWVSKNITSKEGQYLLIENKNDFAIIFSPQNNIDFAYLNEIKNRSGEPLYKQETEGTVNYHFFNNPQTETTPSFFEKGQLAFMASSPDLAKRLSKTQDGETKTIDFLSNQTSNITFALLLRNPNKEKNIDGIELLSKSSEKINPAVQNINELLFISKEKDFFGHIDVSR